jgi:hypothetical protein
VESALKLEPYVLLANEYEIVPQAVLEGKPVESGKRFDRGLRALTARLTDKEAPAVKKPAWLGLLPRAKLGAKLWPLNRRILICESVVKKSYKSRDLLSHRTDIF